jgi:phosphopantetheine--protein transferase-like protein
MIQERIKETLSFFLKIPAAQVHAATVIDRSAVSSSILLHRMYAKLAAEGIVVDNYQEVRTYGDLLNRLSVSGAGATEAASNGVPSLNTDNGIYSNPAAIEKGDAPGVGIDIEMVAAMPVTGDFREDAFYTMNFAVAEIAYCILQPKPYASFAGLFAAKEAMVKADNSFKKMEFKNIVVQHHSNGKPFHAGFNLSIAHTEEIAVAVAVANIVFNNSNAAVQPVAPSIAVHQAAQFNNKWGLVMLSIILVISLLALFFAAKK